MTQTQQDVLVVGAGPTGLTAAVTLARWGVRVRVVDAAAGPSAGSRGKGLQPRTLEVLDGLGVTSGLVTLGRFRMPMRRYVSAEDRTGTVADLHPGAEPTPDSPYARPLLLPQWRTEQVLRERLAELGVEVAWGSRVTDLAQDADGVSVTFEGGDTATASFVIGCDGGGSTVRRLVGVDFLGETHEGVRMLLGDVVLEGLDRDAWHVWGSRAHPFVGLCPLPATETFQLQVALAPDGPAPEAGLESFQAAIDDVVAGVRIREVRWASRWRLNVRMVDRYRAGRVFLAGDAAHVHSPAGAQGMNTGIQDAANLGWKLAHVLAGADAGLLDTYEAERLPVAADVLGLSTLLTGRRLGERGAEGERALQLGVTYRGGPLAPESGGSDSGGSDSWGPDSEVQGPRPGDRAPDAPVRTAAGVPVRLFDLQRGPHWTLLGFGVRPPVVGGPVRTVAIGGPDPDVLDTDGNAGTAYGASDGELVAIRPDGHVGLRGPDAGEIVTRLTSLLPPTLTTPGTARTASSV
ncbi:MAG: FAD-dependent monooxygenase [Pseudonocardia sp.]|nr:FAD-dependent monooxygenase [Pseudonocardia sp.]